MSEKSFALESTSNHNRFSRSNNNSKSNNKKKRDDEELSEVIYRIYYLE